MQEAPFFLEPLDQLIPSDSTATEETTTQIKCAFVERIPGVLLTTDKEETLARLLPYHLLAAHRLGFAQTHLAEQVHGRELAVVNSESPLFSKGVDGLLTDDPDTLLGIHVADCGAVYLADRTNGALALLHSGKKGTELNITGNAISRMKEEFDTQPANLTVVLAPCIRPPHYEIDFALQIREQALAAGVLPEHFHDCGLCTASDLERFYSYRLEKGKTGRLLALLGRKPITP